MVSMAQHFATLGKLIVDCIMFLFLPFSPFQFINQFGTNKLAWCDRSMTSCQHFYISSAKSAKCICQVSQRANVLHIMLPLSHIRRVACAVIILYQIVSIIFYSHLLSVTGGAGAHFSCLGAKLESMHIFLEWGWKPEYLERTHAETGSTCKLHTEGSQAQGSCCCEATVPTTALLYHPCGIIQSILFIFVTSIPPDSP